MQKLPKMYPGEVLKKEFLDPNRVRLISRGAED